MATPTKKAAGPRPDNIDAMPVEPGVETWKNAGPSLVHITKIGEYGRRESELVYGGRVFGLTPQERRLNQSQCFDAKNDPFTNGTFISLTLLDDEPDTERLRANPNVLDDGAIAELFKLSGEAFNSRLVEITNTSVVDRLVDLAGQAATGASVQQLETLKRYKRLLAGEQDAPPAEPKPEDILPKAVTPK